MADILPSGSDGWRLRRKKKKKGGVGGITISNRDNSSQGAKVSSGCANFYLTMIHLEGK